MFATPKALLLEIFCHDVRQNLLMNFLIGLVEHLIILFSIIFWILLFLSSFLIHTSVLQQHTVVGNITVVEPHNSRNMMFMSATTIMTKLTLITQIIVKTTMNTGMKKECTNVCSINGVVMRSIIIRWCIYYYVTHALVQDDHTCYIFEGGFNVSIFQSIRDFWKHILDIKTKYVICKGQYIKKHLRNRIWVGVWYCKKNIEEYHVRVVRNGLATASSAKKIFTCLNADDKIITNLYSKLQITNKLNTNMHL